MLIYISSRLSTIDLSEINMGGKTQFTLHGNLQWREEKLLICPSLMNTTYIFLQYF